MKLKSLAALIFRIIGAVFVLSGIFNMVAAVISIRTFDAISGCVILLISGFCFIYFSKKLAGLFCKGLDDDVS